MDTDDLHSAIENIDFSTIKCGSLDIIAFASPFGAPVHIGTVTNGIYSQTTQTLSNGVTYGIYINNIQTLQCCAITIEP
jgi:S1-C subfamily serine protease